MTTIPVTILDNFFDNPDTIRDWALSLEYKPDPEGRWPGVRTTDLKNIHYPFYNYVYRKIFKLFFSNYVTDYTCDLSFQLVEDYEDTGWIHQDSSLFTVIIYLFKENNINCGTSLYNLSPNKIHPFNHSNDIELYEKRLNISKNLKYSPDIIKNKKEYESSTFEKILDIKDRYNRLICFPSEQFHAANYLTNGTSNSRLTIIGFVDSISLNNETYPVIRSKQSSMR